MQYICNLFFIKFVLPFWLSVFIFEMAAVFFYLVRTINLKQIADIQSNSLEVSYMLFKSKKQNFLKRNRSLKGRYVYFNQSFVAYARYT